MSSDTKPAKVPRVAPAQTLLPVKPASKITQFFEHAEAPVDLTVQLDLTTEDDDSAIVSTNEDDSEEDDDAIVIHPDTDNSEEELDIIEEYEISEDEEM